MKTVGGIVLFVAIGLILCAGLFAVSTLHERANASNDTNITSENTQIQSADSPLLMLFGFLGLILGAMIAINAFS